MKALSKIIGYGLVVLFAIVVIGFTYKYTNGFNEDFKTFYIEYGGKQILTSENKMTLNTNDVHRFDVRYTFDREDAEPRDYNVKIVTNITKDFDYSVDGENYLFSKLNDLTSVFNLVKSDTYFELYLPASINFSEVLRYAQGGKSVSVPADALINNPYPFKLQISSYNEKVKYIINFTFGDIAPTTYTVEYLFSGDATNLSDLSLTGDTKAKVGETVTFKITIGDKHYSISGMSTTVWNSNATVEIKDNGNNTYSFEMPNGNTVVWIYFEYTPTQTNKTLYSIEYDSLGWAGMSVVNLSCTDKAAADETVTFKATIKSAYATQYRISGIAVLLGSGEEYINDLQSSNGTYSFTMPDTATMEAEINEGYITLLFYIVPIDM